MTLFRPAAIVLLTFLFAAAATAQPRPASAPEPILLDVDATDAPRRVFRASMLFPADPAGGTMTLTYPKWIPGEHGPTGPIADLTGVRITIGGKVIPWRRDLADMHAFTFDVPPGVSRVGAEVRFITSGSADGFTAGSGASANLAVIDWHLMLLVPKGAQADAVTYQTRLRLPSAWRFGTALVVASRDGDVVTFAPVTLRTLVDSPVNAGAHHRVYDLTPGQTPAHLLHAVADSPFALELSPDRLEAHKRLIAEALALFRVRHYRNYHFLLTLSDKVAHFGLEHHESSDNRVGERSLIDDDLFPLYAGLLPHEYTHSWCGKFRRPVGLATADFETPMKGDLLWVYEGLTTYLGQVLAARSGLLSVEDYLDDLAATAAFMDNQSGREWRSLQDTADAAQILYGSGAGGWGNWRRGADFYPEMELVWLEVDTLIRQISARAGVSRTLDDFCRAFFAANPPQPAAEPDPAPRAPAVSTYEYNDVLATLALVAQHDWRDFFDDRLTSTGSARGPLDGIARAGWKLVYTSAPNRHLRLADARDKRITLLFSIGAVLGEDGAVRDVVVGGPAERAGIVPGMRLIACNGRKFGKEALADALRAATDGVTPIECIVENAERFTTVRIAYHGGERHPHLVRDDSRPDLLNAILKPLTWNRPAPTPAAPAPAPAQAGPK